MASSSVSAGLTFFPPKCICHFFPVSFSTVWILVIAHHRLGLFKSLLVCLVIFLEMIHPEAQAFRLLYPARTPCQSVVSCTSAGKHGTYDSATLGLFRGFGPCRLTHVWWSAVRAFTWCLLQQLVIFAHTHFTGGCSPVMLWVCRAPSLSAGPSLQREISPSTSGSPQGQFVQEIQRVFNSFFLFIIDRMMNWFLKGKYAYFSLLTILLRPDVWDFLSYYAILTLTA